jgi:c-di-GMP-binding flagellar brake protein YcgR
MRDQMSERRKYQRLLFSDDHNIVISFRISGVKHAPIKALILNISKGGLFFTLSGRDRKLVKKGDQLQFVQIIKAEDISFPVDIEAEIVWIMDNSSLEHIGVGTQFMNVNDDTKLQIKKLIDVWQ